MSKKITIKMERWCCDLGDLQPYEGLEIHGVGKGEAVFCKYCGQLAVKRSVVDAAGSRDWEYVPITVTVWDYNK